MEYQLVSWVQTLIAVLGTGAAGVGGAYIGARAATRIEERRREWDARVAGLLRRQDALFEIQDVAALTVRHAWTGGVWALTRTRSEAGDRVVAAVDELMLDHARLDLLTARIRDLPLYVLAQRLTSEALQFARAPESEGQLHETFRRLNFRVADLLEEIDKTIGSPILDSSKDEPERPEPEERGSDENPG